MGQCPRSLMKNILLMENQTRSQIHVSSHFGHIDTPVCIWHKYPPFLALVSFISMSEEQFGANAIFNMF